MDKELGDILDKVFEHSTFQEGTLSFKTGGFLTTINFEKVEEVDVEDLDDDEEEVI